MSDQTLLAAKQAAQCVYGISERQFHLLRAKGLVPAPVVLGPRSLRWVRSELEQAVMNLPRLTVAQAEPAQLRKR